MKPTIFLDRDGTMNLDTGYLRGPADMQVYPGVGRALGDLKRAGYALVVVSNQSAVGRGICSVADVDATNSELQKQLSSEDSDARVDLLVFCPHRPDEHCACRKPGIGLIAGAWDFDKNNSWMIGDKLIDIEFGCRLGLAHERCYLVQTGKGGSEREAVFAKIGPAVQLAKDLPEAAQLILAALAAV